MITKIVSILALTAVWFLVGQPPYECVAKSQSQQKNVADIPITKIALMPFLMGRLESPNETIAKPLSKPLSQLSIDYRGCPEGSDLIMNRIVIEALKSRFQGRLIASGDAIDVYGGIVADQTLDTPRKRAVRLGEVLRTDVIVVGTVWRFRERGVLSDVPDSPSSIGFGLYIVDVKTGARLWRDTFDGTQKSLTQDVIGGLKQLGMGLRWLSAEELARYGVKSMLRRLPLK